MKKQILITTVIVIIVGVGMFFVGRKFEVQRSAQFVQKENISLDNPVQSQQPQDNVVQSQQSGRPNATGEIVTKDDGNIIIKLRDGSTKKIIVTEVTTAKKIDTINITELNVGQQISATGKNSEDGDFQAQNVTIRSAQ
ncbi:MAG: hypothetical protein US82_C0047G0003 [Parcubacteria group bacterium GW2011_GWC1_38_22]|nr:MAG: hypothetical protein US82_C0047G0003 [Parcubacteria group bacterium GW2011_GWC1_38_22]